MAALKKWLFVFSGLIPLLGLLSSPPDVMLLVYSLYVVAFLARKPLAAVVGTVQLGRTVKVVGLFLLSGAITECLAWLNNLLKAAEEPALFHPQLFADLIIGIGFYGGWAFAWLIAARWFRFTAAEGFLVTGIQGIFFEQLGAVFLAMLSVLTSNPAAAVLFGVYVFLVHGSAVGLALLPVEKQFNRDERSRHWIRFPVVICLMVALAFAGCAGVVALADLVGGLPPKQSIVEHPFW